MPVPVEDHDDLGRRVERGEGVRCHRLELGRLAGLDDDLALEPADAVGQGAGLVGHVATVSAQRGGGIFGGPHYSAAKAGVLGLARAMARELGPDNVRVNCITPGLIQTDITAGKLTDDMTANILAGIPMNRLGDAVDIARAALFLGSDLSSYSTGITLDVNGGMLIH